MDPYFQVTPTDLRCATGPYFYMDIIRSAVQMKNKPPLKLHDFGFKGEIYFLWRRMKNDPKHTVRGGMEIYVIF
jgi:hypothetical protein